MSVREARVADAAAVSSVRASRRGEDPGAHLQWAELGIRAAEESDELLYLVADRGGEIVGYGRAGRFVPPADARDDVAPPGWYLLGVVVRPEERRSGIGHALTRARLTWIARHADEAWYFADRDNHASHALHAAFGFRVVDRPFSYPRVAFEPPGGLLFRAPLRRGPPFPGGSGAIAEP